jgi:uncharacterized protein
MEEILASIRRIIADDDAGKPPAKAAEPAKPAPASAPPVPPPSPAPARAAAPPSPPPAPRPPAAPTPPQKAVVGQDDIDAMFNAVETESTDAAPAEPDDVLELTEDMEAPAERAPPFRRIDGGSDVMYNEARVLEPAPAPIVQEARRQFEHSTGADRDLLSPRTTAAVDSAFNSLAQTVLVQNARTLDDLVREMLRPMLKAWLDDNLPNMVERMVRAEIERVSRGRG